MRYKIILFLMLGLIAITIPNRTCGQNIDNALKKLNLPTVSFNSKPFNPALLKSTILGDHTGSIVLFIGSGGIFNECVYDYDELGELYSVTYQNSKDRKKRNNVEINENEVLNILREFFGNEKNVSKGNTLRSYLFEKNGEKANLRVSTRGTRNKDIRLTLTSDATIKVQSQFDEYDNQVLFRAINYPQWITSEEGLEFSVKFTGFQSTDTSAIFLSISSQSKARKSFESVEIFTDHSEITKLNLTTHKQVIDLGSFGSFKQEIAVAGLSRELITKILGSEIVKMRIKGRRYENLVIPNETKVALSFVNEALMKKP